MQIINMRNVPVGQRMASARKGIKSCQNKSLFPKGMRVFQKMHFETYSFGQDEWKVEEVRQGDLKLSENPMFQDSIDNLSTRPCSSLATAIPLYSVGQVFAS